MKPSQWAMNRAWDEHPQLRADYGRLCTHDGAHALPEWVDEPALSAVEGSYDREIIDKLAYEHNTRTREWIESQIARRAGEIDHYAEMAKTADRIRKENHHARQIISRLHDMQRAGRKTARIADLLKGDKE